MARFAVILPAAGRSTRFGDPSRRKVDVEIDGRAVWLRALDPFLNREDVGEILVAVAPGAREAFRERHEAVLAFHAIRVVEGGAERPETVARALAEVDASCDYVAVHDAARPCLTADLVDLVFAAAIAHGAAVPGLAVADTLKRVGPDGLIRETVPRDGLVAVQTPQAFRRDLLERAYANWRPGTPATDDASLVEALGLAVVVVPGPATNLKVTSPGDLALASAILRSLARPDPEGPARPFPDEPPGWDDLPRRTPEDLFR